MRIVVCGGGIGGLTLAHALQDLADVVVLERDHEAAATGGYRLHLDAEACRVLARALPDDVWAKIRRVSDTGASFSRFTIADDRLRTLVSERQDPSEDRLLCQRVALRVLLAESLGSQVRFGCRVARVTPTARGGRVELESGEVLDADLVVGAEGGDSPTVAALAGAPTARTTGLIGIAGTTRLQPGDPVPSFLAEGPGLGLDASGTGLFLSLVGTVDRDLPPRLAALSVPPSLVWGVIVRADRLPEGLSREGVELTGASAALLRTWDPRIVDLVARANPAGVARYSFRAVDPRRDLTPWRPGPVTALGDAVHCMPPTGGRAAATAIRDAGFLADQLARHDASPEGIRAAVAAYERAMPTWAVPAVRESLGPVRVIKALRHPVLAACARPGLRMAAGLAAVRAGLAR